MKIKFAPDSFFTRDIRNAPLHPNSAKMIKHLTPQITNYYNGVAAVNAYEYNVSLFTATANTPRQDVQFYDCQGKGYVPDGLFNGAGHYKSVPIPANAIAAKGNDKNLTIYDPVQDKLWEFWIAEPIGGGKWRACWGGRIDNVSKNQGTFPGHYGATATSIAFAGGMISLDDVRKGSIDHAMYLAIIEPKMWNEFWWPAQRSDGHSSHADAVPEGAILRLDPSVNVDSLNITPFAKMVAKAAQKHGFVVADKAGAVNVSTESGLAEQRATGKNPWDSIFGSTPSWEQLRGFPWDKMQVLQKDYGKK